jgi:hypothetical protein
MKERVSNEQCERAEFDNRIGRLDRCLSEFLDLFSEGIDEPDRQTLKHHADDLIGVGGAMLDKLGKSAGTGSVTPGHSAAIIGNYVLDVALDETIKAAQQSVAMPAKVSEIAMEASRQIARALDSTQFEDVRIAVVYDEPDYRNEGRAKAILSQIAAIIDKVRDAAVAAERVRNARIAEIVNDSIKQEGKFAAHILNPETCIVPLSGGTFALQPEHVYDDTGCCVYCAVIRNKESE